MNIILPIFQTAIYDKLSAKSKLSTTEQFYAMQGVLSLASMFDYTGLPEGIEAPLLENILISNGNAAIFKKSDGTYLSVMGDRSGEVDSYNRGTNYIGTAPFESYDGVIGSDCGIIRNNPFEYPDTIIYRFASRLAQLDTSEDLLVKYSRLLPVLLAMDEKSKIGLDSVVKKIFDGEPVVIASQNLFAEFTNAAQGVAGVSKVELTEPDKNNQLQYLSHYHDDLLRRAYNLYGQCLQSTAKMAQQTETEVNGNTSVSFIVPLQRLETRRQDLEKINSIFGLNMEVKFSASWELEYKKFIQTAEPTAEHSAEYSAEVLPSNSDAGTVGAEEKEEEVVK